MTVAAQNACGDVAHIDGLDAPVGRQHRFEENQIAVDRPARFSAGAPPPSRSTTQSSSEVVT